MPSRLLLALARSALRRSQPAGASSSFSATRATSLASSSSPAARARTGACWSSSAAASAHMASRSPATSRPSFSTSSSPTSSSSSSSSSDNHHEHQNHHLRLGDADFGKAHINALLYRARQRGFLELDLLLGGWASRHAAALDAAGRAALEELLELENPDLFAWLTGQVPAPPEVARNAAFRSIAADVADRLHRHRPEGARSKEGAKWVRGWDDKIGTIKKDRGE